MASGADDFPTPPARDSAQIEEQETSTTGLSLLVSGMLALLIIVFIGSWRARNR
jgi:hypothetical protein